MKEKAISNFIKINSDKFVKKHLNPKGPFHLIPEFKLDYGGSADWAVIDNTSDKIIGLIECKGEPKLTDFVRGLGQIEQYYQAIKRNPSAFDDDVKTLYVADKRIIKNIQHWDLIHFDKSDNLVIIDATAVGVSSIPTEEYALYKTSDLEKLAKVKTDKLILTGIPFVRDVRFYEVYMGLMALYYDSMEKVIGGGSPNIRHVISDVLNKYKTTNAGNARNVGILIRDLGLIDDYNVPTAYGMVMLKSKYIVFIKNIIFTHYNDVVVNIVTAMLNIASSKGEDWKNLKVTQGEIKKEILRMYGNRRLKNLTDDSDAKSNFIGTCLLVLEQELGAVSSVKDGTTKKYRFNYLPLKELSMTEEINNGIIKKIPKELSKYMKDEVKATDWIS